MALTTYELDRLAADLAADAVEVSLHSADPGTTGASETSASRQTPTWTHTNGVLTLSASEPFTGGAANGAVTYVGLWDTAGAHFLGGFQITTGDLAFNAAGDYTLDDITITFA